MCQWSDESCSSISAPLLLLCVSSLMWHWFRAVLFLTPHKVLLLKTYILIHIHTYSYFSSSDLYFLLKQYKLSVDKKKKMWLNKGVKKQQKLFCSLLILVFNSNRWPRFGIFNSMIFFHFPPLSRLQDR